MQSLPSASDAAYRSLALLGLLCRTQAELECERDPNSIAHWKRVFTKTNKWLKDEGIAAHVSKEERKLLKKPFESWPQDLVLETIPKTEALAALLWALKVFKEMPTYEQWVDSSSVFSVMPVLEPTAQFLKAAKLRGQKALQSERERAEFWHWRARTESFRRIGFEPPQGETYKKTILSAAEAALEAGYVTRIVKGDVPALGKAYSKLSQDEFYYAISVAENRHRALNWLCGYSENGDWDTVHTDT